MEYNTMQDMPIKNEQTKRSKTRMRELLQS